MDKKELNSIFFPRLSDAQIAEIEKFAQPKSYKDGEALYEVGDRDFCFFVVKSGKVEIVDRSGEQQQTVAVSEEKQFIGDIAMLTGDPAVVGGANSAGQAAVFLAEHVQLCLAADSRR